MKPKEASKSFFTNVFSNKSAITSRAASYCAGSNLADRLRHAGIDSQGAIPINNDSGNMIALDGERGINVYKGEKLTVRLNLAGPWVIDVASVLSFASINRHWITMIE
jgi:hypothetical protein